MKALLICLWTTVLFHAAAFAQPAGVALYYDCSSQPPLTDHCTWGNSLDESYVVSVFWDENGNGPDGQDDLVPVGPGGCSANYNSFQINSEWELGCSGGFYTETPWLFEQCLPSPPRFWICIALPLDQMCWRSEIFALYSGPQEIAFSLVTNPADTAIVENAIFCTTQIVWNPFDWEFSPTPFVTSTNNKSLAADDDGTVHLLTHIGNQLLYYRKDRNEAWSDAEQVNDPDSSGQISDMAVFVAPGSIEPIAAWEENNRIWAGSRELETRDVISPVGESAHTPDIAANSAGFIYVVWVADLGESYELHYAWGDGAEWTLGTIPTNIGSFGLGASPRIAVDEEGAAHVVFRGGDFGGYYAKHATNGELGGTNWVVTPLQVPEIESYPGDVAVSADGWVHAVSSGSNGWGMPGGVYRHRRSPEGNWMFGIPLSLIGFDTLTGVSPAIALDTQGSPHATWLEVSGNIFTGNLYYTGWSAWAERAYDDAQSEPAFAIDGLNYGHMVVRGSGNQYYYFRSEVTLIAGVPRLTFTPTELQFDSTEVNHSNFADVRLTNSGSETLIITNLLVQREEFNYPPEWVTVQLGPGEFLDVNLQFQPFEPRDFEGYAIFTSNAQSTPDTVVLRGRGYIIDDATTAPVAHDFGLNTLYPNPFNGEVGIEYSLARDSRVKLVVYDVLGREVAELLDEQVSAGVHHLNWNCSDCAAGVYLFELVSGEMRDVKKAVYLK